MLLPPLMLCGKGRMLLSIPSKIRMIDGKRVRLCGWASWFTTTHLRGSYVNSCLVGEYSADKTTFIQWLNERGASQ